VHGSQQANGPKEKEPDNVSGQHIFPLSIELQEIQVLLCLENSTDTSPMFPSHLQKPLLRTVRFDSRLPLTPADFIGNTRASF
jgi:hypothetical protein